MNTFEIVILALALVFNSWSTYLNAGLVLLGETTIRKIRYGIWMLLLQFIMAGVGIWIGNRIGNVELRINMLISIAILLIFGMKVLLTTIKIQSQEKAFDYTDHKVVFFAALAEGITPMIIGLAVGLISAQLYLHWILIGIFLFLGIISGLVIASKTGLEARKIRLGPIGGFLLLAAALKLILNIVNVY